MRIAHVVTLVSADGAFGGPLSVALGHVAELARRGHTMTLYAGWDGVGTVDLPPSVDVRLHKVHSWLPGAGLAGLVSPAMAYEVGRRTGEHDVVHLHQGRDLVSISCGHRVAARGIPYLVQTHGMIGPDPRRRARVLDRVVTRRVLTGASSVLSLTEEEDAALDQVVPGLRVSRLRNGIAPGPELPRPDPSARPEVLFLARLSWRKRVLAFAALAVDLLDRGAEADFVAVGPDEGDLEEFLAFVESKAWTSRIRYEGAIEPARVRERLSQATVFVLPSIDEPFPMTVLEALATGTPTVVTDSCHIGADLAQRGAVSVSAPDAVALADAVESLLTDPAKREAMSSAGREAVRDAYGIGPVVDQLEIAYAAATQGRSAAPR